MSRATVFVIMPRTPLESKETGSFTLELNGSKLFIMALT